MSRLFFCYRRCLIFVFCSESHIIWSGPIFRLLARPNSQHRLVLARHRCDETTCVVSQSTILENPCAEAVRMGSQSSISKCRRAVTMCMGRNPQFWSSSGAQPEIRQDMRMISSFWKISKSGATAAHAHSLTFYAPPRDSIAIPASLMRGD